MPVALFLAFIAVWCSIQYADGYLLQTDRFKWYSDARLSGHLNLSPWMITIHTDRLNRALTRIGHKLSSLSRIWYSFGTIMTLLVFFTSIPFLILSIISNEADYTAWFVKLLHAGVISESAVPLVLPQSLPLFNFLYIFISVSFAVLFHELGHALCAVAEQAPLINVGILSFLCFPGAFVKMDLNNLSIWPKIRVFSAGVWHNLILSLFCYILLENRDLMLTPLYSTHRGFVVLDISPYSSIGGEFGVARGDVLDKINDCDLKTKSFDSCLQQLQGANQLGFCGMESIDTDDCCPSENATHICFESGQKKGCLRARSIVESSDQYCFTRADCDAGHHCIVPVVNQTTHERLLVIHNGDERVLYLGTPMELIHSMVVINYVPRISLIPISIAPILLKLLDYTFTFSLGMAFFNALPCVILDGNHISGALIELILPQRHQLRILIRLFINVLGTFLICLFILVHLIKAAIN